jgi:microcystin degradation protein MlrC
MRPAAVATLIMAAFGPIAKKVIDVETDAPLNRNYRQVPLCARQPAIWPLL